MGRPFVAALFAVLAAACGEGAIDDAATGSDEIAAPPAGPGAGEEEPSEVAPKTTSAPEDPANTGPLFRASYDGTPETSLNTFYRYEAALQAGGTLTIATRKGQPGSDPEPEGYHGGSFYNGGTFRYAAVASPPWTAKDTFDTVTPSFEASTPPGTWIEVHVAARLVATGQWTKDYSLGVWAEDESTVRRHSVSGQKDENGDVTTDTLVLTSPADALQVYVTLFAESEAATPELRAVSAITSRSGAAATSAATATPSLWGKTLAVPKRSQMVYPESGADWSAPTSASMLLGFWGIDAPPPDAAERTSDVVLGGAQNRVFAAAFASAAESGKLHAMVTRLSSLAQVEPLVASGIPVAIDVAYGAGELAGAPLASAAHHTLVVRGFSASGAVVVNDPAFATDDAVETTYDRTQLTAAFRRAGGTAYVAWPATQKLPVDPLGAY